ncbi:hypothetical protein [Agromyces bauzanensis]|uniref:Uncharacterized protein n=1 Tax=Agromyces bauzanensis TaxID=1308924 RepID=A0A917PKI4_9MICO|nr:hypothetical protein [Agromyces bauzanensis]GGJ81990.1 hypothetical protein GCM10011372_20510 [Agromyces bauzanensis]
MWRSRGSASAGAEEYGRGWLAALGLAGLEDRRILDRRDLYEALGRLGMPTSTTDSARRRSVMSPLRITAIGSALTAAVMRAHEPRGGAPPQPAGRG